MIIDILNVYNLNVLILSNNTKPNYNYYYYSPNRLQFLKISTDTEWQIKSIVECFIQRNSKSHKPADLKWKEQFDEKYSFHHLLNVITKYKELLCT